MYGNVKVTDMRTYQIEEKYREVCKDKYQRNQILAIQKKLKTGE